MDVEENILNLIPQSQPFVMVSKLLFSDKKFTRTSFIISEDNVFVENGEFREPGLIENIAQTAAAGAGYRARSTNKTPALGYIGAIKNLEIFSLPKINDELITEIIIEDKVFDVTLISGRSWCNEVLIARCEMKIFLHSESQLKFSS